MEPKKGVDTDTHVFVFQLATLKICTIFLTIDGWPSSTFARKTTATLVLKSRCGDAYVFLCSVRLFVVVLWKQKNKKHFLKDSYFYLLLCRKTSSVRSKISVMFNSEVARDSFLGFDWVIDEMSAMITIIRQSSAGSQNTTDWSRGNLL